MLRFDNHVAEIFKKKKKASKQIADLKRLGRFITKQGKMTISNFLSYLNLIIAPWSDICGAILAQTR